MPNPPTCSPKTNSTKPAAKRKVSPTSAKGGPKVQGRAEQPALDPVAAASDTMLISPTLLAALIARSIRLEMAPLVAELRDIARTSHDTSDRLFGESLKAKAHNQWREAGEKQAQAEARFKEVFGVPYTDEMRKAQELSQVTAQSVPAPKPETSTDRLQGLMDKLWAQGYRPSALFPRSFHEFEFYVSGMPSTVR